MVVAKLIGLYDRDHVAIRHLTVDELPALAAWAAAGVALLALVLPQTPAGEVAPSAARWRLGRGRAARRWSCAGPPAGCGGG